MTQDFAEDFCQACDKEDEPYVIMYRTADGGCRIRWSTQNWDKGVEKADWTTEEDMLSALRATIRP